MSEKVFHDAEQRMQKAVEAFRQELAGIRAGRATIGLVDRIRVEYYGSELPLNQSASISTPDAHSILIQPWDKGAAAAVSKAIMKSDLSLTPNSDGNVIRLNLPPLTEERRKELARQVSRLGEETRVAIRNVRREANDRLKAEQKASEITEDDEHRDQDRIQKITDQMIAEVEQIIEEKAQEIQEV